MDVINPILYLFFAIFVAGIIIVIAAYQKCQNLNLNPPTFYTIFGYMDLLFYIREQSRIKEYSSLKVYYYLFISSQIFLAILFCAMFIVYVG